MMTALEKLLHIDKMWSAFLLPFQRLHVPLTTANHTVWRCGVPLWPIDLSYLFHGEKPVLESDMLLINSARQCKMSLLLKSDLKKAQETLHSLLRRTPETRMSQRDGRNMSNSELNPCLFACIKRLNISKSLDLDLLHVYTLFYLS